MPKTGKRHIWRKQEEGLITSNLGLFKISFSFYSPAVRVQKVYVPMPHCE